MNAATRKKFRLASLFQSDGTISIELDLVLPVVAFRQFFHRPAFHPLNEEELSGSFCIQCYEPGAAASLFQQLAARLMRRIASKTWRSGMPSSQRSARCTNSAVAEGVPAKRAKAPLISRTMARSTKLAEM
jgi:hypothetical protein